MEINGLPLHPLVVHAAVVFGPLGALLALAHVCLPSWRERLRVPALLGALLATVSIVVAYLAGVALLDSRPELEQVAGVDTHEARARVLVWVTLAFGASAVAGAWLRDRTGAVRLALDVALGALALAVVVLVVLTGDAGSRAVWGR